MLSFQRQQEILQILKEQRTASVQELCQKLYASPATIRRDLHQLENQGLVKRNYGGVSLPDERSFEYPMQVRESRNLEAKEEIAQKALEFIRDGQTVFLDSSSTALRLALRLREFPNLHIVTNGIDICQALADTSRKSAPTVYCCCGRLRDNARTLVGATACQYAASFHADLAVLSCRGLDRKAGSTEANEEERQVKRTFLEHADRRILLCDHSKIGKSYFCRTADLEDYDRIITDRPTQLGEGLRVKVIW